MKILSTFLIVAGFIISAACSLAIFYTTYTSVVDVQGSPSAGIGSFGGEQIWTFLLSFPNIFGLIILAVGILLAAFGRKQTNKLK